MGTAIACVSWCFYELLMPTMVWRSCRLANKLVPVVKQLRTLVRKLRRLGSRPAKLSMLNCSLLICLRISVRSDILTVIECTFVVITAVRTVRILGVLGAACRAGSC